ncbi:uncharacterized protein LOC113389482 [Ctenocephalides felis]|uniref:uncharacterized protein LOC113389482 n=1 Tax=Ctenocephalides felis TaxID=7515 RepID=UPI000E6E11C6|nr:uncharacterized protein LOC113389482 [Ctenocephalides felis]
MACFDEVIAGKSAAHKNPSEDKNEGSTEIDLYLSSTNIHRHENPYNWWHARKSAFPYLIKIAAKYLSAPGSSVYSERLLSEAGMVYKKKRKTTGEYITRSILQELDRNGLDIQNYRGQGYDNGANMVGINKDVGTRILFINPRAFSKPCGCHSWNLLLIDAAKSSGTSKKFLAFVNKIFVLFAKSSKRWDIVRMKLKLTLKPLSETRWESRIGAVKAIFLQFDDVIECVNELQTMSDNSGTLSDCDAVLNEIMRFEFIVAIQVWYEMAISSSQLESGY